MKAIAVATILALSGIGGFALGLHRHPDAVDLAVEVPRSTPASTPRYESTPEKIIEVSTPIPAASPRTRTRIAAVAHPAIPRPTAVLVDGTEFGGWPTPTPASTPIVDVSEELPIEPEAKLTVGTIEFPAATGAALLRVSQTEQAGHWMVRIERRGDASFRVWKMKSRSRVIVDVDETVVPGEDAKTPGIGAVREIRARYRKNDGGTPLARVEIDLATPSDVECSENRGAIECTPVLAPGAI